MKIYRGPISKPFYDLSHEFVSRVSAEQLEDGMKSGALITFNITKDGTERHSVCTAKFEDDDLIPMIGGLLSRLKASQDCLARIRIAVNDAALNDKDRLIELKAALSHI